MGLDEVDVPYVIGTLHISQSSWFLHWKWQLVNSLISETGIQMSQMKISHEKYLNEVQKIPVAEFDI